ncbi:MAG: hypothetical protein LUQ50_06305, partial [Methanospirillum sp.]|uniref:hypothetical protein n=1 Tax=Methanospirillum sp. TaxID=45200 RepID=UPI00236C1283
MKKIGVVFNANLTHVTSIILVTSLLLTITIGVASASESTANPFHPPLNPDDYPLPASITAIGSSTSFTSSSGSSDALSAQKTEVITENRQSVLKNQSPIHMINFKNEGNINAVCLSGSGFELYSKKSDSFPEKSAFRSDYGSSSMVTNTTPVTLDITPG